MSRATTYTLLPLDRFFEVVGFDLIHANQLQSALRPIGICNDVLYQHTWQYPNQAGREEIARAIKQAEDDIAAYINYQPVPAWIRDERQPTVKPARRELFGAGVNVRWIAKSVNTRYGHFISGGMRAKTLIDDSVPLTYSDSDGDGYEETVTATVSTSVTDACEVRAFFAGEGGVDCWEIRPIAVALSGGVATLSMKRHQLVDPTLWEALDAGITGAIDADDDANFVTEIDVYRVYNDPSQQVQFLWEPENCGACNGTGCAQCEFATQYGCLAARDERLGAVTYRPGTWNADNAQFDAAPYSVCREPDKLRLWYYAGFRNDADCAPLDVDPYLGQSIAKCSALQMHPYLERTITMLALSYIQGDICDCTAVKTFFNWAQEDLALQSSNSIQSTSFALANRASNCPWGTRRGAVEAFARCNGEGWRLAP